MTAEADSLRLPLKGVTEPRIAPPLPLTGRHVDYAEVGRSLGINLYPWQELASRYLCATGPDGWLFREVCIVVARQNGKTELLVPRIVMDLRAGKRILHTAHRMRLARKVFLRVARALAKEAEVIRFAQGQEEIFMPNGGSYVIVAAQRGARGEAADTLIIDEVREFEDSDVLAATTPTLSASPDPQIIYLSNAGSHASVVLNDLKKRGEEGGDGEYAYLEWSADPALRAEDRRGWEQANPALGHRLRMEENLEQAFLLLPPERFETEHLCRWVATMHPKLVSDAAWNLCQGEVSTPDGRTSMAFNMDQNATRASAAMAWAMADGRIALVELIEAIGDPIDIDKLGIDLKALSVARRARQIGFASWTDAPLARHMPRAKAIDGKELAAASGKFAELVSSARLVWDGASHVSEDLAWTSRKPHESGAWIAVPASPERPVTSVLAAIRAVWLASQPKPAAPRIG